MQNKNKKPHFFVYRKIEMIKQSFKFLEAWMCPTAAKQIFFIMYEDTGFSL